MVLGIDGLAGHLDIVPPVLHELYIKTELAEVGHQTTDCIAI